MTKSSKKVLVLILIPILAVLVAYCAVCGKPTEQSAVQTADQAGSISAEETLTQAQTLAASAKAAYENRSAVRISLADGASSASAPSVQIQNDTVTLTAAGVYQLSGTLTNGQIIVDTDSTVTLILDGADITSSADAAITVTNAEHVLIYLPDGSENRLVSGTEQEITAASDSSSLDTAEGAALYARDNLSFAGNGSLRVGGYINNGIATTDRLTVLCGTLNIEAANNGLKGKDSVLIVDGTLDITSGNDGIKSNNDTDADCGTVELRGGTVNIFSLGDGVQAERDLTVADGTVNITTGSLTENAAAQDMMSSDNLPEGFGDMPDTPDGDMQLPDGEMSEPPGGDMQMPGGNTSEGPGENGTRGGTAPEMPDESGAFVGMAPSASGAGQGNADGSRPQQPSAEGESGTGAEAENPGFNRPEGMGGDFADMFDREWSYSSDSDASTKGLKSGGNLTIGGGSLTVTSTDDCLHADGNVTVTGGTLKLSSGDDGIHADDTLTLDGAQITVTRSYEGLEAYCIYLKSGEVSVTASDDGLNANGGSAVFGAMYSSSAVDEDSMPTLQITGGTLYVNAGGDGLDSNGDLIVENGTVIVDGPSDNGNGALDSGTESGGVLICNGGTVLAIGGSGMAECFDSDSAQPSFIYNFSSSLAAGSEITVKDAEGNVIFSHTAAKAFNSVVFSSADLVIGTTVTLTAGDQNTEISIDGITNGNSSGSGFGGFGGNRGGVRK